MTLTYLSTLDLPEEWFAELARRVPDAEIHRYSGGVTAPRELLARVAVLHTSEWFPDAADVPALRCVQLDTSGVDHVRRTTLWETEVPIATLGGIAPVPMAEYALMTILELAHRMPLIQQLRDARVWPTNADRLARLTPRQLAGATLGIVGYGRIGREISRLANAFGMKVLGVKRSVPSAAAAAPAAAKFDTGRRDAAADPTELFAMTDLDEVIARCDILLVTVPLTELTRGMIGAQQLDRLAHGALVVNISRGGIVDEHALVDRLRDGRIGGVALDVFDEEPLSPESHWWSEPGALITPHVAGLAPQYHAQTLDLVVENLTRVAEGRPILNEVDRDSGY